jgi:hypothetical protein
MAVLKWGMSQAASDAYKASGHDPARLGQTIGNAVLSAGTHEQDGVDEFGNPYSAAVDLSVMHPTKLVDAEIRQFCDDLFAHGFWPFPRLPWHPDDGWPDIPHVHCIYLGKRMKGPLQTQVHEGFAGRNGLADDGVYHFWQPADEAAISAYRALFLRYNPD